MKTYQALIILKNTVAEEEHPRILDALRHEIEKLQGEVSAVTPLGKQTFARPMRKTDSGYYARIAFRLAPKDQAALLARWKLNDALFRVQIVRLDERARPKAAAVGAETGGEPAAERKTDG